MQPQGSGFQFPLELPLESIALLGELSASISAGGDMFVVGDKCSIGSMDVLAASEANISANVISTGNPVLSGSGLVHSSGMVIATRSAKIVGACMLAPSCQILLVGTSQVLFDDDISAIGTRERIGTVNVSCSSDIVADSYVIASEATTLDGSGSIRAIGIRQPLGALNALCSSDATINSRVALVGLAVSAGCGYAIATGIRQPLGAMNISCSSSVTIGAYTVLQNTASLAGSVCIDTAGGVIAAGLIEFVSTNALVSDSEALLVGDSTLTPGSSIEAKCVISSIGSANMPSLSDTSIGSYAALVGAASSAGAGHTNIVGMSVAAGLTSHTCTGILISDSKILLIGGSSQSFHGDLSTGCIISFIGATDVLNAGDMSIDTHVLSVNTASLAAYGLTDVYGIVTAVGITDLANTSVFGPSCRALFAGESSLLNTVDVTVIGLRQRTGAMDTSCTGDTVTTAHITLINAATFAGCGCASATGITMAMGIAKPVSDSALTSSSQVLFAGDSLLLLDGNMEAACVISAIGDTDIFAASDVAIDAYVLAIGAAAPVGNGYAGAASIVRVIGNARPTCNGVLISNSQALLVGDFLLLSDVDIKAVSVISAVGNIDIGPTISGFQFPIEFPMEPVLCLDSMACRLTVSVYVSLVGAMEFAGCGLADTWGTIKAIGLGECDGISDLLLASECLLLGDLLPIIPDSALEAYCIITAAGKLMIVSLTSLNATPFGWINIKESRPDSWTQRDALEDMWNRIPSSEGNWAQRDGSENVWKTVPSTSGGWR